MPIYTITYVDGTSYKGGESILDSKWNDILDKPIARLEYFFCKGESLILEGFEEYNHVVEAVKPIQGPKGTDMSVKLKYVYVMGCKQGKVISYRLSLDGKYGEARYLAGDITKRVSLKGTEYGNRPSYGWKKGIQV